VASLRELQASFAASLRDPAAVCAALPAENIEIYRNNAATAHRSALECSFPVLRKRVGDDYFRQLAAGYRQHFPSRSGDLHWVGRDFAAFLETELRGSEYAWLADLARLEWSREEASVAAPQSAVGADVLARFAPHELEQLSFSLQPSLRLQASEFPIFTIWRTNQADNAPPADQSLGAERGMVRSRFDGPEVRALEPAVFSYLSALAAGLTLGNAVASAALNQDALVTALGFVFREGLVCRVAVESRNGRRLGTSS
jgi:hypothetical protein